MTKQRTELMKAVGNDNTELIKILAREMLVNENDDEIEYYYAYSLYKTDIKVLINYLNNKIITNKEKIIAIFNHIIEYLKITNIKENVERFFINQSLNNVFDVESYLLDYYEYTLGYKISEEKRIYEIVIIDYSEQSIKNAYLPKNQYCNDNYYYINLFNLSKYNKTYCASLINIFKKSKIIIDKITYTRTSTLSKLAESICKIYSIKHIVSNDDVIIDQEITKAIEGLVDVRFYDGDEELQKIQIKCNSPLLSFPNLNKDGYNIVGYYIDDKEIDSHHIYSIDTKIDVKYHLEICEVSYYDGEELLDKFKTKYNNPIGLLKEYPKCGYTFLSYKVNNEEIDSDYIVKDNIKVDCIYEINTYMVTIILRIDQEENLLEKRKVCYNNKIGKIVTNNKEGYSFDGITLDNKTITEDYTVTSDITIYINYSIKTYTVTLRNYDRIVEIRKIIYNNKIGILPNSYLEGYTFLGYFIDDIKINADYIITKETIVDVRYSRNECIVNFYNEKELIEKRYIYQNTSIYEFPRLAIEGYSFEWFINNEKIDTNYLITQDTNVNLKLIINEYNVKFIIDKELVDDRKVRYNSKLINLPTKEKVGYVLDGWYTDSELNNPFNIDMLVTKDTILYSEMIKKQIYEVEENYVLFGTYPQTLVTDTNLINRLSEIKEPNSQGYYVYNGIEYLKMKVTPDTASYIFSYYEIKIIKGCIFFQVEPIKWRILNNGINEYYLLSFYIIDRREFYSSLNNRTTTDKVIYPNNYSFSNIRKWLNDVFHYNAFNRVEKKQIITTTTNNSALTTEKNTNKYVCSDSVDKVHLLCYQDVINKAYKFSSKTRKTKTRKATITDYVRILGCYINADNHNNGYWWLRSPVYNNPNCAYEINNTGAINYYDVDYKCFGVRPAITIKK